jgi:hypothetical protein
VQDKPGARGPVNSFFPKWLFFLMFPEFPQILHNKEAVDNLYQQVKAEIESGLHYLLQKRKEDPYESFIPRIIFENTWGHSAPTFNP